MPWKAEKEVFKTCFPRSSTILRLGKAKQLHVGCCLNTFQEMVEQWQNVHILKKSENSQKNHSNPNNIENSIVDQSGDHVESVHILQALSKNTHENHSDPKINQNFFESDCEKIQNLADKESKTSQENHSDSKRTKGQLISKYPFGVIVFTKIPTKNLANFCPRIWRLVKSTK